MDDVHDWQKAADERRDRIFRRMLGLEKEKELEPVEELSLLEEDIEISDEDCYKDTEKIKPPTGNIGGCLFDFYDDEGI